MSVKYPKNWNANGYGWHNLKGLSYSKGDTQSDTSSGVSSMCPYPPASASPMPSYAGPNIGFQMSYGFAPGVMPNQVPNPNVPRGSHEASFGGSSTGPNIGWALSRGDSVNSGISENAIVSQEEIPCQSIFVPEDEMPIYGNYGRWSKLSTTSQQLDCMQRHADGCGDLWIKQTGGNSDGDKQPQKKVAPSSIISKTKPNDWVVIPVFADIVRLAVQTREECLTKLPNGHMNVAAFYRLAAVVGAFTRHMSDVNNISTETGEYETVCRHMQNCTLQNDRDLILASFDCEEPNSQEKQAYHLV